MNWGSWLDEYDREARLVPALFALLPVAFVVIGFGFEDDPLLVGAFGVAFAFGTPLFAAKQVANMGRNLEERLYSNWGGPPTTRLLVLPNGRASGEILVQRRTRIEHLTGIILPTNTDLTPSDAETYSAAVRWLIANTRDHGRFPVVWAELKSYGFERNLLAIRKAGVMSSTASATALLAGVLASVLGANIALLPAATLCATCILIGFAWWVIPTEERVRVVAERYAERLLDSTSAMS